MAIQPLPAPFSDKCSLPEGHRLPDTVTYAIWRLFRTERGDRFEFVQVSGPEEAIHKLIKPQGEMAFGLIVRTEDEDDTWWEVRFLPDSSTVREQVWHIEDMAKELDISIEDVLEGVVGVTHVIESVSRMEEVDGIPDQETQEA